MKVWFIKKKSSIQILQFISTKVFTYLHIMNIILVLVEFWFIKFLKKNIKITNNTFLNFYFYFPVRILYLELMWKLGKFFAFLHIQYFEIGTWACSRGDEGVISPISLFLWIHSQICTNDFFF